MVGVVAASLLLAGCGGGDAAVDTAGVDPAAANGAPATTDTMGATNTLAGDPNAAGGATGADGALAGDGSLGATEDIPGANEISNADAASGTLVKISALTPKKFSDAHCSKPIMVVLYQPGSILDERLYDSAKAAAKRLGEKDLVTLAYTPREVKAMGDLPSKLGLLATPGVATVGRNGTIENFWTTYVDEALIEASLKNAAASKPCKLTSEDVPAPGSALEDATTVANGGTVANTTTDPLTGTPPGTPAVDAAGATASAF